MPNKPLTAKDTDWETPPEIFNPLNAVFHFDLDVCANQENAKCRCWYGEQDNGLAQAWHRDGRACWLNPPYGQNVLDWVRKAYQESLHGCTVVCLIQARPDTRYWQDYCFTHAKAICFIRGRIKFIGGKDSPKFPSALVVFAPDPLSKEQIAVLKKFGAVIVIG